MKPTVGIVGTGMLGGAVALRLLDCGFNVVAYNRTVSKLDDIIKAGGLAADTPAALAGRSDVIFTVVKDAEAVKDVSFGDMGISSGVRSGSIVCDMSTILPAESRIIHKKFQQQGIDWLDTPVMGGPDAAAAGRLVVMASGSQESYRHIADILDAISEKRFHLGDAGAAHSIKLSMNMHIAILAISLSEGIWLARKLGVEPDLFLKVLNSTYFGTGMSRKKAFRMIQGQYPATFTLANLTKDLQTVHAASGVHLPLSEEALHLYENALRDGLGDIDYTGILEYIKRRLH